MRVGRYRLIAPLARGGSAVVYAAERERDRSPVAIKLPLQAAGPAQLAWFRREAALAVRLSHPGIVRMLGTGTLQGRPYLVFDRIDGPTLEKVADELDAAAIVSAGAQLLDALGYAHDAGVVHCDVKPDNVLVAGWDERTGAPHVRLADFGLAAATREPSDDSSPALPVVAGTPGYLSPEQARGVQRLAAATDIYSVGAVLYRLIAGFPPHLGGTSREILRHTLEREPLPLRPRSELAVPEAVLRVVDGMLARDPHARPASAHRARNALLAAAGLSHSTATPSAGLEPPQVAAGGGSSVGHPFGGSSVPADPEDVTIEVSDVRKPALTPHHPIGRHVGKRASLVGRDAELADVLSAVAPEAPHAVVRVVGPAGTGRTRLLEEAMRRLTDDGVPAWRVTGRRGVRSPPLEVLAALALDVAGGAEVSPPWVAADKLSHALTAAGVAEDDVGRDALVAGLVGVGLPTAVGPVRLHAFRAFRKLLEARSVRHDGPVLFVDDADDADEDSLAVLESLAAGRKDVTDSREGAVPRVVLSAREPPEPADSATRFVDVRLEPMAQTDSAAMLAELLGRPPESLGTEARACRGLPADAFELACARLTRPRGEDPDAPATLGERVDRLPERKRAVLEAAAIHDGDIPIRSVGVMAAAIGRDDLDAQLAGEVFERLMLDELFTRPRNRVGRLERTARFASPAVRRHVRAGLRPELERVLHAAAARWIGRECHDTTHGMGACLAAHAEAAGDDAAAAYAYAQSGRVGASLGDPTAPGHLSKALTLTRASEAAARAVDEAGVLEELARQANLRGEPETAELLAREGLERLEAGRVVLRARLWTRMAEAQRHRHRLDEAIASLDEALEVLGPDGDPMERAAALASKGWILGYLVGRNDEGIALGRRALDVAARIEAPSFRASLCGRLGANLLRAGDWDGQLAINHQDLGLSLRGRNVAGVIRANINIGVCYTNRGLPGLARAHTERALELAQRFGHRAAEVVARNNLAMLAADEQRWQDAEELAVTAIELADRAGLRSAVGEALCTLARAHLARGRLDEADRALDRALELSEGATDHELADRIRGLLQTARGDHEAARRTLSSLLATDESDPYERASSRLAFAAVLRASGDEGHAALADEHEAAADAVYGRLGADPEHERRRWRLP